MRFKLRTRSVVYFTDSYVSGAELQRAIAHGWLIQATDDIGNQVWVNPPAITTVVEVEP